MSKQLNSGTPLLGSLKTVLLYASFLALVPASAGAFHIYTLSDGNSSFRVDASRQRGAFDWDVDGQDQLNQQWFWYRVGDSGPEASLDTLGCPKVVRTSDSTLQTTYRNDQFSDTIS